MNDARFDNSVSIFVGLGFPREVETVMQAHQVLTEWPFSNRGPAYTPAFKACQAALSDCAVVGTVRDAFEAFARDRGVLAPGALDTSVRGVADDWFVA